MTGDPDRKTLWGRAGSRCAVCNVELTLLDGHNVIVGDEAHIRSKKPDGPRHDPDYDSALADRYRNLILLCKAHHKLIDTHVSAYPTGELERLKETHEKRVARTLNPRFSGWIERPELTPVVNGTYFFGLVSSVRAWLPSHDQPADADEALLIGEVLQNATDWGELSDGLDVRARVEAAVDLDGDLDRLAERRLFVFGGTGRYRHETGLDLDTAVIHIARIPSQPVAGESDRSDDF